MPATEKQLDAPDGGPGSRARWVPLAFVAALLVVGMALLILRNRPEAAFSELLQVNPGMSKDQVADILGGPGRVGPYEENFGPSSSRRWDDCWSYRIARSDQPGIGVVCFRAGTVDIVTGALVP